MRLVNAGFHIHICYKYGLHETKLTVLWCLLQPSLIVF